MMSYLGAVFEFGATFVEQEQLESTGGAGRLKVGRLFAEPLAQLSVHRRVLRFIKCLVEY